MFFGNFGWTVLSRQTELRAQIFFGIVSRANSFVSGVFRYPGWTGIGVDYPSRLGCRLVGNGDGHFGKLVKFCDFSTFAYKL